MIISLFCLYFSDSRDVMNGHGMRVHSVKYHPTDPHLLISGGWDDTVQVSITTIQDCDLPLLVVHRHRVACHFS